MNRIQHHRAAEVYLNSRSGQRALYRLSEEEVTEYAETTFIGVFATPEDAVRLIWAQMPEADRLEYVEAHELPESPALTPHPDTVDCLYNGMVHSNVVEFIRDGGEWFVYDETRY